MEDRANDEAREGGGGNVHLRSRDAGTEEMHGQAANAPSDVTSDGEEEIAGLVHAKRAQADADEDAHGE